MFQMGNGFTHGKPLLCRWKQRPRGVVYIPFNVRSNLISVFFTTIKTYQKMRDKRIIWIEDLIEIAEKSASSGVFTLLRRTDEKLVTDQMFSNPTFVEDVVRNVIVHLKDQIKDVRYIVKCENMESIHPHNAYAEVSGEC